MAAGDTYSGQGTTYQSPNYHGELFVVTPTETPFLSMIGGLGGAKTGRSVNIEWQAIKRRTSTANNSVKEGQPAPSATNQPRLNVQNILEVHQSAIEVSYTKQAAVGDFSGANIAPEYDDVILDELAIQTQAELESMAVDIEKSFLSGTYHKPTDNTTARATQGILGAISTNVFGNGGTARALSSDIVNAALQGMFENGAKLPQDSTVLLVSPAQKVALTKAYTTAGYLNAPVRSNTVGGVSVDTVITDFGTFGVAVDRWMPAGEVAIVDVSVCYPWFLEIPDKGLLFVEELARTGASRKFQLYGEVGLEYGAENFHGLITDLS
jgi:hypothetical protein